MSAGNVPKLGTVVKIKRDNCSSSLGRLHTFDNNFGRGGRERGEDTTGMEPTDAPCKNVFPVEVTRLELGSGFIAMIIKNYWGADTEAAITIYRGHVRPMHAVVFEMFVERLHPHGAHTLGEDRKSTRLNSSHRCISYAVFCLKKKKKNK